MEYLTGEGTCVQHAMDAHLSVWAASWASALQGPPPESNPLHLIQGPHSPSIGLAIVIYPMYTAMYQIKFDNYIDID